LVVGVATAFNWRTLAIRLALLFLAAMLLLASPSTVARQGESEPGIVAPEACSIALPAEREREPNDEALDAQPLDGPVCVTGEIEAADQDVFRWELDETAARERWTFVLSGLPGQAGVVRLFRPTFDSDGSTVTAVDEVIGVTNQPGDPPATINDVLLPPGVYLIGVGSSGPAPYHLDIHRGTPLPPSLDQEPNDTAETATMVAASIASSGDQIGSEDRFAWSLDAAAAASHWRLSLQGVVGNSALLRLVAPDGTELYSDWTGADGRLILEDVGLTAGTYQIVVSGSTPGSSPYVLEAVATGPRDAGAEDEPNDTGETASPIVPTANTTELTGKLGTGGANADLDTYRLVVDETLAGRQLDLKLFWDAGPRRRLCLRDAAGTELRCTDGERGIAFNDLVLAAGDYTIVVSGDPAPDSPYLLRLDASLAAVTTYEAEPNDTFATAGPLDATAAEPMIAGRLSRQDVDYFRTTVQGEPQLWRVVAEGTGIGRLTYLDASSQQIVWIDPDPATGRVELTDLYLLPGNQWFSVSGEDGDYTLRLVPLGPPEPSFEREPNDTLDRSQPLRFDETRTGRLTSPRDVDVYRFTLLAEDHVSLTITPPTDGSVSAAITWGGTAIASPAGVAAGEPIVYEASLLPGTYTVALDTLQANEQPYQIAVERLDPFRLSVDLEPNDHQGQARPLPIDRRVDGFADPTRRYDADWFLIAAADQARDLLVDVDPDADADVSLQVLALGTDGIPETPLTLEPDARAKVGGRVEAPAGQPLAIGVTGIGKYHLMVDNGQATGSRESAAARMLPLTLELAARGGNTVDPIPVAAYWPDAQRVEATLSVTNISPDPLDVHLDATSADDRWQVTLAEDVLSLPPGDRRDVPVSVRIAPDARATVPIPVTVRARDDDGNIRTAAFTVAPDASTLPVNPEPGWTLPPTLLGGLNVAWSALGAAPVQPDPGLAVSEALLYDDLAIAGLGWRGDAADLATTPLELTMDLAGDEPVPVAGVAFHPYALEGTPSDQLREFEVSLSLDGQTFSPVLSNALSARPDEQAFALDSPVDARFARLRIRSTQFPSSTVVLGEWKVIATPGWTLPPAAVNALSPAVVPPPGPVPNLDLTAAAPVPADVGFDLAAPARGGHVVVTTPQLALPEYAEDLLLPAGSRYTAPIQPGRTAEWILGFHHDRAAQITALTWADPLDTNPAARFETVELAISVDSPVGPWEPIGTWTLDRASPEPRVFALAEPRWARFVRFTAVAPPAPPGSSALDQIEVEFPAQLRVFERALVDDYPTILGEWGQTSTAAGYEVEHPPQPWPLDDDGGDRLDNATPLPFGDIHRDSAWVGRDEDWYRIDIPADVGYLTVNLTGSPAVEVDAALLTEDGGEIPLTTDDHSTGVERLVGAPVAPGDTYWLRITEPPSSLVIAFDTSSSMGAVLPTVYQAIAGYARDVAPGQEVVNYLPFGEDLLIDEWADDPYVLLQAINNYPRTANSSNAEEAQLAALETLAGQPGAKAILVLTDAETGSFDLGSELWATFTGTRPRVFAVHLAASSQPNTTQNWMQDWAAVNHGHYAYVYGQGDVDVAFERAAANLRRPAMYAVSVEGIAPPAIPTPVPTSTPEPSPTPTPSPTAQPTATTAPTATVEPTAAATLTPTEPGTLSVVAPAPDAGAGSAPLAGNVSVALIVDTSGSMLQPLGPTSRADVAKSALIGLVTDTLPPGMDVSLRSFGVVPDSCDTRLVVPRQPLDPSAMVDRLQDLEVVNLVKTPLGDSLAAVAGDLGVAPGPKIVVLVTDGEETCGGDPQAAIAALVASGIDVRVNIVGFALDDDTLRQQFQEWARLGKGQYIDAVDAADLNAAIAQAVQPLYNVIDSQGNIVASGQVGGSALSLPAGTYRVEVLTQPTLIYEVVRVASDQEMQLVIG
jgi:hypothetical protein